MKVYLVWSEELWGETSLFRVFSKEEDAEECIEAEKIADKKGGWAYGYHITEEEVE